MKKKEVKTISTSNKNLSKTEEQKEKESKERIAKYKAKHKANKSKNDSTSTRNDEKKQDWFASAVETLTSFASNLISISYASKKEKYFNIKDKKNSGLVRSIIGAENTQAGIEADIAKCKYPNQLNPRQIVNTIRNLADFDEKKESITWTRIFNMIVEHQNKSTLANSAGVMLARKVDVLDNFTNQTLSSSKSQINELMENKAIISREIAKLSVSIRNTSKNLGFFGWLFHPMQTYRNSCAKDLVKELKHIQHKTRVDKKHSDPEAWLLTVFKYLFLGNEAMQQGGVNDDARRLLIKSFKELQNYQKVLENLKISKSEVTSQLKRNINKSIDNLMEADARLKMEWMPNRNNV